MYNVPQLNETIPSFEKMRAIKWQIVCPNLFAYFLKKMVDVSVYIVLIMILGVFELLAIILLV